MNELHAKRPKGNVLLPPNPSALTHSSLDQSPTAMGSSKQSFLGEPLVSTHRVGPKDATELLMALAKATRGAGARSPEAPGPF